MSFLVESAGRSDAGLVREQNEDSFVVDADLGIYAVCDGMGGHVGGQVASQTAVAKIAEVIQSGIDPDGDDPDRLATAIRRANRAVFEKARAEPALHNMGTTVVGIREDGDLLHLCHVGDSRIYRLRHGELQQVTVDHSLTNLYASNPELAARFGPLGPGNENVIVRAVGLREQVDVDHRAIAMEEHDVYLLCSDGLTDMVDDWILKELLEEGLNHSIDDCADALIRAALGNGGVDNVTAVVLRISVKPE
jgi:serine/threonine protein phosphatase PrpC